MKKIFFGLILFGVIFIAGCTEYSQSPTEEIDLGEVKIPEESKNEIKILDDGTKYIIHPDKILSGGSPKDGIPSIDNPKFISIQEADEFLDDEEFVLGIEIEDDVRAYPLSILVWHEVVNDFIDNKPILVTYCPLCFTGISFEREINGRAVEFGTSGKLYNNNLVMYDRATNSYWSQETGRAIIGELTGSELKKVPIDTIQWKDWKKLHPNTKVLSRDTGFVRDYERDPYGDYYKNTAVYFPVENTDNRLHPKTIVYGIEVNDKFKAYPDDKFEKDSIIEDTFNSINLEINKDKFGRVRFKNEDNNKEIIPVISFWFSWAAFHPDTELYTK
ncbi:DUF3179 domain-containing protein [Candidatus Woesearchaeota archaeon]|nr:DUF3179 domain-containing protein [Candidatus Woesearchaeota archaeon]